MTQSESARHHSDVLIIGSGISGASAALMLAGEGLEVTLVTKEREPGESSTWYAQGGIAGLGNDDSPELLARDIMQAGDHYCYKEAVDAVTAEGPGLLSDFLIRMAGVKFDRDKGGAYDLTREAAHSRRRIYHYRDATGSQIESQLIERLSSHRHINLLCSHQAIDLITFPHHSKNYARIYEDDICCGAYILDLATGQVKTFFASSVILATGGIGQVYLHTTNPHCATGDGVAMAYRAGARIINAEFVQFHPTALLSRDDERFLISEALRGEGARLLTKRGELFMKKFAPDLGDLAPRDVVSRAIHEEMTASGDNYVLLDIAHYKKEGLDIKKRFPTIFRKCREYGIDITKEPIPVVPVAHYFCGGVKTDLHGETTVKNLYAVGETACSGVHGANRLASVSLLEGLVWGIRAARRICEQFSRDSVAFDEVPGWQSPSWEEDMDPVLILQDWHTIKTTMWNYAGIVRTRKRLSRAYSDMNYLHHRIMKFYKESALTRGLIELRNAIIVARLIIEQALQNKESRGCHYLREGGKYE
ncbi:MAG: L-aspartate oxidase [Candidatus Eremiobacteraeota bacterium]|nr:L-aspartate oxidase [Candidatus Eremiobacteraeota bacterium]